MVKESTGYSPFQMVYGAEAQLPCEAEVHTIRTKYYDPEGNEEAMRTSLDLLDEIRDKARHNLALYQVRMRKAYNRKVISRPLKVGDLVLRKSAAVGQANIHAKLSANWEGSYTITEEERPGTYRLTDMEGRQLPAHWNTDTLRKYFA